MIKLHFDEGLIVFCVVLKRVKNVQKITPACGPHKQPQLRGTDWDIWCAPSESVVL